MTYDRIRNTLIKQKFQRVEILKRFFNVPETVEHYLSPDDVFLILLLDYDTAKTYFDVVKEGMFRMPSKREGKIAFVDGGLIINRWGAYNYEVFNPRRIRYYLDHYKLTDILGVRGRKKYRFALVKHPKGRDGALIMIDLGSVTMLIPPAETSVPFLDFEIVKTVQGDVLFKEYMKYFQL